MQSALEPSASAADEATS